MKLTSTSSQLKNIKQINKDQDDLIDILTEDFNAVKQENNSQDQMFARMDEKIETVKENLTEMFMPTKEKLIEHFKTMVGIQNNTKIIYFDGSTEDNPAKIHGGQTYNIVNPFPGKTISGRAEIFFNNEWIECPKIQLINKSDGTIDVITPEEIVQSLSEVKARLKIWAVDVMGVNVAIVDNALVGEIRFTISKNVAPGWLPLNGNTYSREQYSMLWDWANNQEGMVITEEEWQNLYIKNNGNVIKFSSGDESTTFRLPCIKAWTKGTDNVDEVGTYLKPGLPNIAGNITFYPNSMDNELGNPSGAFSAVRNTTANTTISVTGGTLDTTRTLDFNASRYNGIYGNSEQVQPASVVGLWIIKAYENTMYDANDKTIQDLQQVVDKTFVGAEVVGENLVLTTNTGQKNTIENVVNTNRVGKDTVGAADTPIYLNEGVPTPGDKLGSAAYKNEKDFATATHAHQDLLSRSGGTMTGAIKGLSTKGTTGSDSSTGLILEVPGVSANTGIYNGTGTDIGQADMIIKAGKTVGFVDGTKNNGITVSIDTQTGNVNLKTINGNSPLTSNNYSSYAAAANHTHDDRYYTESEVNALLAKKSDTGHTHSQYLTAHATVDSSLSSTSTNAVQNKVINAALAGKAASNHTHNYAASSHTHDDRYYTESEIDTKLAGKANSSHGNHVPATQTANNATFLRNDNTWQKVTPANIGAAAASHTHSNYLTGITKAQVVAALGYTPPTTNTTYGVVTSSANGLMTPAMLSMLESGGGIAAASFGTNNYVKFVKGLIIQWGVKTTDYNGSITFPISFENVPSVALGIQSAYDLSVAECYTTYKSITKTGFTTVYGYNSTYLQAIRWIAVGK